MWFAPSRVSALAVTLAQARRRPYQRNRPALALVPQLLYSATGPVLSRQSRNTIAPPLRDEAAKEACWSVSGSQVPGCRIQLRRAKDLPYRMS
jgi:hypothetical protein